MRLFGKNQKVYGVIVDVHSGSVGTAIVHLDLAKKTPELIFSHREHIKILENPNTAGLIRALRHALFSVALQLQQEGMKALREYDDTARILKTLFVCGAPWAHTATRFIHVEDKEPFLITEEKVKSLIVEAERRDEEELQTTTLLKELNVALIESAIVNTAVNGYPSDNPYGKKARELSLAHISGLIPQTIIDAVADLEEKVLPRALRTSHTFALVLFCVLREMYPHTRHAVCIDISGESTELAIMQDEVLLETYVIPYGTYTFVRDVARELQTFPDEALTHIKEYGDSTAKRIRASIDKVSEVYVAHLKEAYTALGLRYSIPKHFFLLTSRNLHTFFDAVVHRASEIYIGEHGSFISLNKAIAEDTKEKGTVSDVFFNIESRFFHKLHGCGDIT